MRHHAERVQILRAVRTAETGLSNVEALLAATEQLVATALVAGRPSRQCGAPTRLLGEILATRLARAHGPADADVDRRLETAEAAMRSLLEQWHARRSHLLEWIIIALIALDIVILL